MKAIAQEEIVALISDINIFVDSAENLISATQSAYNIGKRNLQIRHSNAMSSLESNYRNSMAVVRNKSQKTIGDAKKILTQITELDERLSAVDKYYVKTKKKREEMLSDKTSSEYDYATDYFDSLARIQESFNVLFRKYSEDILPALLNGINYFFSSKRKKDYEELIVLRNTVTSFVQEIEKELPLITEEHLATLKEDYFTQRGSLIERYENEIESFESKHLITLDDVAGKICIALDNILPDEFVEYLYLLIIRYEDSVFKVNSTSEITDEVLNMMFVDYPVDFFVQSKIVASIIKEKCEKILVGNSIRFPIVMSVQDAPVWMIANDNSNQMVVHGFIHSIMFGMLSALPVSRLMYSIVDPENRGNSISPYFDVKKKLPELFDEKIFVSKDDVASKIRNLNEYIEGILQDKLGNQYGNIFEYAKDHDGFEVQVNLLTLYDFPKGFDEHTLAELRNILRNGSRCGIYTIISYFLNMDGTRSY